MTDENVGRTRFLGTSTVNFPLTMIILCRIIDIEGHSNAQSTMMTVHKRNMYSSIMQGDFSN